MDKPSRTPTARDLPPTLVTEKALASRWLKSVRTLQRWRQAGNGPAFLRIGGSVFYRNSDISVFEQRVRRDGRGG